MTQTSRARCVALLKILLGIAIIYGVWQGIATAEANKLISFEKARALMQLFTYAALVALLVVHFNPFKKNENVKPS